MDFFRIREREVQRGKQTILEIYPDFVVGRSKDLMVRAKNFYAVWDEDLGLWNTDEYRVQELVDQELESYSKRRKDEYQGKIVVKSLRDFSNGGWKQFRSYLQNVSDNAHQLDNDLAWSNTEVKKKDYVSKRLDYPLEPGDYSAWIELMSVLYEPEELQKLEWAIGSIVSGDAKDIQKFVVLYGAAGTGKSTVINIVQKLFKGYYTTFEAKALTTQSNAFSTEMFKSNPLVAIQHDGDLSRIEDNTKLNSIISHEEMTINEKNKPMYTARLNSFLFMGTNKPVRITDAKSGIIRRLIDVRPTGHRVSPKHYHVLMSQIGFELGAIASHCLDVYRNLGKDFYSAYVPVGMMMQTDVFFNYVEAYFDVFNEQEYTTLQQAWDLYKEYCTEALIEYKLPRYQFREELKNYFDTYEDRARIDDQQKRNVYIGFDKTRFGLAPPVEEPPVISLVLDQTESLLDEFLADQPAQYSTKDGIPERKWADVTTVLHDLDTRREHYVRVDPSHIVIDFDLRGEDGSKSAERNLEAASQWPPTYAEFSKSGSGVHLHYIWDGDCAPEDLGRVYAEGIEIKVYTGQSALRRRLTVCNSVPVATISSGLPVKEAKPVIDEKVVKSEKGLRDLIERNLRKEIHPGTKPSVDFIYKILEDAYLSGLPYDLTDLRPRVMSFAAKSTHQAAYCLGVVAKMKFKGEERDNVEVKPDDDRLVFFDVEVFPNLFVVVWKFDGEENKCVRMINPTSQEVEDLFKFKLVGFNNRRYDNHILYGRYMGYSNEELYKLSQRMIDKSKNASFLEAYNLSYTDIYDFSSKKQSLKKFQIELGIHHQELGLPWDEPVETDMWDRVAEYCENDVVSTEATFHSRKADFEARQILASLSGLTVNDTTQKHAARIIFGKEKHPQDHFIYTDLSKLFPGYSFDAGKSSYRGEEVGEGGYVYSEPGIYRNVALLDVASMHPNSIRALQAFGDYTKNFTDILDARVAIKHGDFERARTMLRGALSPYLREGEDGADLAYALKIVINIVYGLTSASFDNPFRDPRNKDNIVAKRGALFMIDLKHFVQDKGFTVAHIKTDSIKIPDATPEIIEEVIQFGKRYGYDFEHEATYDRMCLVNDAVYIAHDQKGWHATGTQFAVPYVFKTLFSHEDITFDDLCELKTVTTSMFLHFGEDEDHGTYQFIGRAGSFCPILPGRGGGTLLREKEGKYYAVGGTKGYYWLEAEAVKALGQEADIDRSYYDKLVDEAVATIGQYGDAKEFIDG